MANSGKQELVFRRILIGFSVVAGIAFLLQASTALWTKHGITEVEAIIAAQATALSRGSGLYYNLNEYPFTVSPYGPLLYGVEGIAAWLGLSPMLAGRVISLAALAVLIALVYRLLALYCDSRYAPWAGALLAASTANLVTWGSVGQSDMLALMFSVAALERYCSYQVRGGRTAVAASGVFVAAAIFTKQKFLAAGATICVLYLLESPKRAMRYIVGLGCAGIAIVAVLNWATSGGYWSNAVLANLNPFSLAKLGNQLEYFGFTASALCLLAAAGLAGPKIRGLHPFAIYLGFSAVMFLATAPKIGSDLNYQTETVAALSLCAALALDRVRFFPLLFVGDKGWVTLLQIPLLFHMVLNCAVTGKVAIQRVVRDLDRRDKFTALTPLIGQSGRLLSVEIDPVLQTGRLIEVEPLIYTLLVNAGMSDPQPVLEDLRHRRFDRVVLYEDVFDGNREPLDLEVPSLPVEHLQAISQEYALPQLVPGPLMGGVYVYAPKSASEQSVHLPEKHKANP
ncbi:MAG: hypothetical protein O3A53_02985 [Acidobacteria bacterium]|nr:hypothetical protein [Acidobacteriota bacterium]MDA1233746.1 hypothetical protein [Acidobacteriota bacterium]